MSAITITFGDQAENHVGMQKIGKPAQKGFSVEDLEQAKAKFESKGYKCELVNLNDYIEVEAAQAKILVVKRGTDCLLSSLNADGKDLFEELLKLDWDSKAFMYGRVVNKHARHNLCFSAEGSQPDYENGHGRVVSWENAPLLKEIKSQLDNYLPHGSNLQA